MGSKTTKTKETATTTPNVPSYAQGPVQNYYGKVDGFLGGNMEDYTTPANTLQNWAFGQADSFANPGPRLGSFDTATAITRNVAGAEAPSAALPGQYNVANVANVNTPTFASASVADLPSVAQAGPVTMGEQAMAAAGGGGPVERANAESLLTGFQNYLNPGTEYLVDQTLESFDDSAARAQAAYAAQAAGRGAFGGSRQAIGEAQLGADIERQRGLTEAELRNTNWLNAANLSNLDAGRRQETGLFNAGQQNESDRLGASLGTQASIANANNASSRDIAMANLAAELGMFNAGQTNNFGMAQFNALNDTSRFNAGEYNDLGSQVYDTLNANARQNAASTNQARGQFYDTEADMNRFNADKVMQTRDQQLQAAGMLPQMELQRLGYLTENNDQLMDLGNQLWELQNQNSGLNQLATGGALLDPGLLNTITGQTINSQGTTKQSGGLMSSLLSGGFGLGSAILGR